jgi:hypothetical protein
LYDAVKPEIKDTMSTSLLSKKELFERLGVYDHWDKLKKDIPKLSRENVKFEYTFEEFTNIPNDLPDLIFIDEITHFNALELKLLNDVIASVSESGRNIRIIGAGDLAQKGATVQSISYNVERVSGTFSPILSITLRSSNVQKRVNNDTLEGIVNYAIANYETSKDTKKIVEFIKDKLSFRYYKDANIINGDLIVNSLNKELLSILASNPEKKIGVLLTEDQEATFRNLAEQVGINPNQVKYFTPDNIQGSESDYFIFNTKNINEEAITHKLKSFYTYMSRSKDATIIIDDFKINDLNYRNAEPDSSPEYIQPLTGEIIQDSKNKKLQKLTEIVDPNLNILYDFVFNAPTNIEGEFPVQTEVVETIISDTANKEEEIIPEDNMKFIYHSFYNDLNVKVTDLGDSVILRKSNQINSGLNILFKEGENEIEISKEEFNNFSKELILLKYEILGNIKNTKDNYIPSGNELLKKFLGEKYRVNSLSQKLVIKKTIYNKDYNAPFEKFGDKASEHLESGDEFVNIYLKITKDSKNYYIQIATAPKIQTIVDYFSNNDLISKKYPK